MTTHLGIDVRRAMAALPGLDIQDDDGTRIETVMSWGGFVHRSFRVMAAGSAYHVKLACDGEDVGDLRRWRSVSERLAERYGAPPMVGWIDLPSHGLAGPVLNWIDGRAPTVLEGDLRAAAAGLVRALHADRPLARSLERDGGPPGSCGDAYRSTYHRRFVADLFAVRATPPPFITPERMEWMESEAFQILREVEASEAFDDAADRATHQDLWLNNLIVEPDGTLRIIDWDGVRLGDPMMDWAMLLGPAPGSFRVANVGDVPGGAFSRQERARWGVLSRASLLDWVIDSLADWVEAPPSANVGAVREAKRVVHEEALATYRERGW